jgi:asparagine synthase (glutamine-hydrolysing)
MKLICGIFHLDSTDVREELLRRMAAQMSVSCRRPSLRLWQDGPIGLAVLDFSASGAPAPAFRESGAWTMAADVRLDEPDVLRRKLGGGTGRDTEDALLLSLLEKFGPTGLDWVLGDFAFASWNRTTQHLTCGRDAFGIRPFAYVYQPGKLFAFSSFPKALHGSGIIPKKINEDALAHRMVRAYRGDDCLVAGINRLPPAHFLKVSREGISLSPYWQLDRAAVGSQKISPEAAARELRRLLDEAVRCRLPRTGEIAAHLSGGLDSSAIAVLAARKLREEGRTLHAYSFLDRQRNDMTLEDETEFVKAVVDQESDIDWSPIRPSAGLSACGNPLDADQMTLLSADEPENAACARAEEQRVDMILSGWGGDEGATFNGRGAFAELLLRGRWQTLVREVLALKRERSWSVPRILYKEIITYLAPEGLINFVKRVSGKDVGLQTQFCELMWQSLSTTARRRLPESRTEQLIMTPDARANRWRLMTSPHLAESAEAWAQTGARYGLAFVFPLLDRRVVEFSLSLPSELFVRGGFRRRPFRDAMVGVLPERVRLRHLKYRRFPSRMLDVAERKNEFLSMIDTYEQSESVRRVIDLPLLRRQVEAFPPPECLREEMRVGNPLPRVAMGVALNTLAAAEYLLQHGD